MSSWEAAVANDDAAAMIDLVYLRRRAAVHARLKHAPHLNMAAAAAPAVTPAGCRNDGWRRYGRARRQELVDHDAREGGNRFDISGACPVERYFALADRAARQFRRACPERGGDDDAPEEALERAYLMGHRLVAFLSEALPQHPGYWEDEVEENRAATVRDLVWVNERLEEIALRIDEEQLNRYVDEYLPQPDEDDDDDSSSSSTASSSSYSSPDDTIWRSQGVASDSLGPVASTRSGDNWESFQGWMQHSSSEEEPHMVVSDASTNSNSKDESLVEDVLDDAPTPLSPVLPSLPDDDEEPDCPDPDLEIDLLDEEEDEEHGNPNLTNTNLVDRYDMREALRASSFLWMIAEEPVVYETDSEACDSWAQDAQHELDEPVEEDGPSCDEDLVCDPARLVLNRASKATESAPLPAWTPPTHKATMFEDEDMLHDETSWPTSKGFQSPVSYDKFLEDDAPEDEARSWVTFEHAVRQPC